MSTSTVQLAADLGSFNDLETGDVLDRISGALRGEYDSLQAIIPNINGTRVEHEALAASGKKTASELTAAERATATLAIVTADGARAVGDFARTADSASNTSKTLAAQFEELQVSVGNKLMPAWQAFQELLSVGIGILGGMVEVIADVVSWFSQLPGPVQAGAAAFALWVTVGPQVVGFLKGLMFVIPMIMSSLGGMAGGMRAVGAAMLTSFGGPIGIAILGVTAAIGIFMSKTEAAQTTVSNFAGVIDEATGKLAANADEVLRNGAAESGHLQAYKAMGGVVTDYTGALKGLGPEQDRVHTAILDAAEAALTGSGAWSRMVAKGIELSGNSRQVASDILASGDAGQYASGQFDAVLGVSGNLASDMGLVADESGKAAVKLEDAAGGAGKAGDAAADAGDPMKNLADATKALGGAASDADTATQFLIASLIAVNGGTVTAQQAADLAAAAFRGIAQSQRDNSAAHDGVTAAALKVTDAEAKLADVTAHLGDENTDTRTTAEQVTAAQLDLADAHRGVDDAAAEVTQSEEDMRTANIKARDAAIANASSAFTLAGGYDNVQASSNAANQKIEEARTAFINAQPEADRLSGKAAAVAQSLFGIPGETVARMREAGGDGVIGTADDVKQAVNQIPGSHNTDITVSGGAQEVANNIRRAIELIPGYKQLVIESKLVGAPIPLPHLGGGFRRGGATPDTGPYTVDNQPIIAHRGEHVLDGNDVNKLGGQAGTYGFRDALTAGGAQAAAMWLLQRNGGLPGAMAPAGSAVTAQANTGPRTVIQFGDVRVGEYRDATDLLNRAAYMGVN
jgi:hypothetical protein